MGELDVNDEAFSVVFEGDPALGGHWLVGGNLDGWNPDVVATRMAAIQKDQQVLQAWARNIDPPDPIRWDLRPEMDYVDGP